MARQYLSPQNPSRPEFSKLPFTVLLSDIRSRENVGSIFRTADAAGVEKIFLCGITPKPPHEKISKTALGAENTVAWEYHAQAWRLLKKLNKSGYMILALEKTSKSKNIFEYKTQNIKSYLPFGSSKTNLEIYPKNGQKRHSRIEDFDSKNTSPKMDNKLSEKNETAGVVLLLGNEVAGVSKKLMDYATDVLYIPMYGAKESLNVAVAFGIAIYSLKVK